MHTVGRGAGAGSGSGVGLAPSMPSATRIDRVDFASRFHVLEPGRLDRKVDIASQAAVATAFEKLQQIAQTHMDSFVSTPVLDEDDNEVTDIYMTVQLATGAITLMKGEKKAVCLLKDFAMNAAELTEAQKLLAAIGKEIGAIGVWDPLRSAHTDGLDILPVMKDRRSVVPPTLHECTLKDIVKCKDEAQVKRYVGIVRHGAVMKHEHRSGLELLKLRYLGERADILHRAGPLTEAERRSLKKELSRIEEKIGLIDKKILQIDYFDGYALSKMALYASRLDKGVTTDEQREAIARDCKADIVAELEPLLSKNRTMRNPFGRETTSKETIEKFAAMVAGSLLSDDQRSRLEGFKCPRPFEAAVCFDPAVSSEKFTSALPGGLYDDLGDECKAFMYEIHEKANLFGKMAALEEPTDKDGNPIDLTDKKNYVKVVDASCCTVKGLRGELLGKDHRDKGIDQHGKYRSIEIGGRPLYSASYELEELCLSYHLAKKDPGSLEEEAAAIVEFRERSREHFNYETLRDRIRLDYTNMIQIRNPKKPATFLSVPPLRRFDTRDTETIGDPNLRRLHYSRPDLIADSGDELYDYISGEKITEAHSLIAARERLRAFRLPADAPERPYIDDPDLRLVEGVLEGGGTPPATPVGGRSRASSVASGIGVEGVGGVFTPPGSPLGRGSRASSGFSDAEEEGSAGEGSVTGDDTPPREVPSPGIDSRVGGVFTPEPFRPESPF